MLLTLELVPVVEFANVKADSESVVRPVAVLVKYSGIQPYWYILPSKATGIHGSTPYVHPPVSPEDKASLNWVSLLSIIADCAQFKNDWLNEESVVPSFNVIVCPVSDQEPKSIPVNSEGILVQNGVVRAALVKASEPTVVPE